MEIKIRNKDILFDNSDLEELHTYKNFPVFMGCTNNPIEEDLRVEQSWDISLKTGIIQLRQLIPLDILYSKSHNSGVVGSTWLDHHNKFADFILKQNLKIKEVLEIGGGHGILSIECHKKKDINWTILEPNPSPFEGCKATYIEGYFNDSFLINKKFDTIIHSHVLEHIYDPKLFLDILSKSLEIGTKMIFSIPNMKEMLKRLHTNCLCFEHTIFLTEDLVDFLMTKYGFEILEKEYYQDAHSIFYSCERKENTVIKDLPDKYYETNKKLFNEFITCYKKTIKDLNSKINKLEKNIYLFGAHIFSQYLLQMGLNSESIISILDNDKNKQGSRLYGTNLMISSPEILKGEKEPIIILRAGNYNSEIKRDILENINPSTVFI